MEELYYEGRREELEHRPARAELPVEDLIQNWRALETLKISSHCHPDYVRLILGKCKRLRDLEIGRAVDMSDWDFSQIFSKGDSSSMMMMMIMITMMTMTLMMIMIMTMRERTSPRTSSPRSRVST